MTTVLLPFDATDETASAVPIAREIARLERARVLVLHTGDPARVARDIRERLGESTELTVSATEDLVSAVVEAAETSDAPMVVMSTRSGQDPPHVALGLTARGVLAGVHCPVILVRPERGTRPWLLHEVLVPHDGTPATSEAICPAGELARRVGARLFALHIASAGRARPGEPGSLPVPRYVDQPQHEWPEWAGEFVERLRSVCPVDPSQVRFFLGHGQPASEILRIATQHGVDLMVLAWHGTLGAEHAGTFKILLRSSPCPMMVLRVEPRRAEAEDDARRRAPAHDGAGART